MVPGAGSLSSILPARATRGCRTGWEMRTSTSVCRGWRLPLGASDPTALCWGLNEGGRRGLGGARQCLLSVCGLGPAWHLAAASSSAKLVISTLSSPRARSCWVCGQPVYTSSEFNKQGTEGRSRGPVGVAAGPCCASAGQWFHRGPQCLGSRWMVSASSGFQRPSASPLRGLVVCA